MITVLSFATLTKGVLTEPPVPSTHDRIIEATLHVIEQDGYRSVSLRSLASSLGLTTGAFYRHFSSKTDVLLETGFVLSSQICHDVEPPRELQDPFDKLLYIADNLMMITQQRPRVIEFLFSGPLYNKVKDQPSTTTLPALLALMRTLCQQAAQTYPSIHNPERFYEQMWSVIQGYGSLVHQGLVTYEQDFIEETLQALMGISRKES